MGSDGDSGGRDRLGRPRVHLRTTTSTNDHARALAAAGAPHGTVVTAGEQTAGRGRQGRSWSAPAGRALLLSVLLREDAVPPTLLPLRAALAVAATCGDAAQIKWPNDVWVDGLKVAGILVEARPQEGWAVVGIGLNVAVELAALPPELRGRAGTLGLGPADVERVLAGLMGELEAALALAADPLLAAYRARDALAGRTVSWDGGSGTAAGIDGAGRLRVRPADGGPEVALDAGEVHLAPVGG